MNSSQPKKDFKMASKTTRSILPSKCSLPIEREDGGAKFRFIRDIFAERNVQAFPILFTMWETPEKRKREWDEQPQSIHNLYEECEYKYTRHQLTSTLKRGLKQLQKDQKKKDKLNKEIASGQVECVDLCDEEVECIDLCSDEEEKQAPAAQDDTVSERYSEVSSPASITPPDWQHPTIFHQESSDEAHPSVAEQDLLTVEQELEQWCIKKIRKATDISAAEREQLLDMFVDTYPQGMTDAEVERAKSACLEHLENCRAGRGIQLIDQQDEWREEYESIMGEHAQGAQWDYSPKPYTPTDGDAGVHSPAKWQ